MRHQLNIQPIKEEQIVAYSWKGNILYSQESIHDREAIIGDFKAPGHITRTPEGYQHT